MGTKQKLGKRNKKQLDKLTDQQRMFCMELMADNEYSLTNAAKKAGYKAPSQAAYKLMQKKEVQLFLADVKRKREERCKLTGDDVLEFLRYALYFNPLEFFEPSPDGGWTIPNLEDVPPEVGRLIEDVELKVTEYDDGSRRTYFKIKFISKSLTLSLAMKHTTVDQHEVLHRLDWDSYLNATTGRGDIVDVSHDNYIQERLKLGIKDDGSGHEQE